MRPPTLVTIALTFVGCAPAIETTDGDRFMLSHRWLVECMVPETGDLWVTLTATSRRRTKRCGFDQDVEPFANCEEALAAYTTICDPSTVVAGGGYTEGAASWFPPEQLALNASGGVNSGTSDAVALYECGRDGQSEFQVVPASLAFDRQADRASVHIDLSEDSLTWGVMGDFAAPYCAL